LNQIFERKKEIRKRIDALRRRKPAEWILEHSRRITETLAGQPFFKMAATVHTYVSWRNEVDTHALIQTMLEQGKNIIVPKIEGSQGALVHARIHSLSDLLPGAYGIPEPTRVDPSYDIREIDIVLVPGVAFDRSGYRLGFGGGYYDTFLKQLEAQRVGLAFDFQLVEEVPRRAEDEKVDIIITENEIIQAS